MFSVLIVDDDIATVDVIRDTVDWGALGVTEVLESYNIEQAKKLLSKRAADIIISDIEMPGGTGIDLLEWYRAQGKNGQFLLLTCHESFTYASRALHHRAADYLLKPFDAEVMEMTLRRIVSNLWEQRHLLENDKWVKDNQRQLRLSFWEAVFRGRYDGNPDRLWSEVSGQNLRMEKEDQYYIAVSRITNLESDAERYGRKLFCYALENIHSELLCGTPENSSVVCLDYKKYMIVCSVCELMAPEEIERRCRSLMASFQAIMRSELTCCICGPCDVGQMFDLCYSASDAIASNVAKYGTVFWEKDLERETAADGNALDIKVLSSILEENKKREFLEFLKTRLEEARLENRLSERFLMDMRQQILQALYVDLAKFGINASEISKDAVLQELSQKSTQSSLDMLRWATGAVNATLELKKVSGEEGSLQKKVDQYIEEHYREELSRDRIAEVFYLSPGYLGKLYKKHTGKNIKDKLAECRVTHARQQLANPNQRITEIAMDVGFENVTYFSTTFKKYTGMTPYEYRKSILGEKG